MAHHLEGRVDLTAIERSRLLGSLSAGSLGQLGSVTFSAADSSLSQLSASGSELSRSASPTTLQQYASRFLPSSGLPPTGTNYAMMASYLSNAGHVPEALKHLIPEMQQYWSAAQQDSYARYLLGNMYYPYLPYLPATESLALFAQNSNVAQMEAALQAQAVQHRIYDLQKEALFGQSAYTHSLYPHSHLYSPNSQLEATNLSLPSSSRDRPSDRPKEIESGRHDIKKESDKKIDKEKTEVDSLRLSNDQVPDKSKPIDGSERTRGRLLKTEDRDKIKSSAKLTRTQTFESDNKKLNDTCVPENLSKKRKPVDNSDIIILDSPKSYVSNEHSDIDTHESIKSNSNGNIMNRENGTGLPIHSPVEILSLSPTRHSLVTSPENCPKISESSERKRRVVSPVGKRKEICVEDQDMPENLCIKDRDKSKEAKSVSQTELLKTHTINTTSTVDVNSKLDINTTDVNSKYQGKASSLSPSQTSPSLSKQTTVTTYSLPYYHNLYARSQPQDGKRVHATTYVPEIGTISSPVAGAPSVINVVDTKHKLREKLQSEDIQPCSGDRKSPILVIPTKTDNSKQKIKDFSQTLFIETSEQSIFDPSRDEKSPIYCNNRSCVQSNLKSSNEGLVSPTGSDSKCTDTEKSIDLSMKKNYSSRSHSQGGNKDSSRSPVMRKREVLNSPKGIETEKLVAHDLRKFSDRAHDLRKNHDKPKENVSDNVKKSSEKRKACDLNHNSKDPNEMEVSKKLKKYVPSKCVNALDNVISLTDSDDLKEKSRDSESDLNKNKTDKTTIQVVKDNRQSANGMTNKHKNSVKPLNGTKDLPDIDKKNTKQTQHTAVDSPKPKSSTLKQTDGNSQPTGIPVGIAVARQRNIAPKVSSENDTKKTSEDTKKQHPVADVKPIRPLKVIRPSTKGCGPTVSDKRNELPANLIVTGGATPPGVFWPDDPASRQLAAQFLQAGHPLPPTSWYGAGAFPFPQNVTTTSSGAAQANQMPFTVPAGYKLAQDSVTGQILLLPTGSDVFDSSRLFSGLPVGSQITGGPGFGNPVLPSQSTPVTLSATPSIFPGHSSDKPSTLEIGLPTFAPMFTGNVLNTPEVAAKDDKLLSTTQSNTTNAITPSIILTAGHESTPGPGNRDATNSTKSKIINLSQTATVSELAVVSGQPCTYTFPSPTVPIVLNQALLTTQNVPDNCPEVTQLKHDHTSVQSRGTSPMLPASDSCAEDTEENKSDDNADEILEVCDIEDNKNETVNLNSDSVEIHRCEVTQTSNIKEDKNSIKDDLRMGLCSNKSTFDSLQVQTNIDKTQNTNKIDKLKREKDSGTSENKAELELKDRAKSPRSSRNIFTDLTEYNPFMDPQVLQAADGLELLSALAEKSAMRLNEESIPKENAKEETSIRKIEHIDDVVKVESDIKEVRKVDIKSNNKSVKDDTEKRKQKDIIDGIAKDVPIKPRIKCGFAFKPKKEKKKSVLDDSKKMTTFCGISIPEDDDVIDSIEMQMKMRLAELQKRYREKQKQLAKLTPKKLKDTENKTKDETKQKTGSDTLRGPGRPKKKMKDSSGNSDSISDKLSKSKTGEHGSKSSPPSSTSGGSAGQHGPAKKKKLAEMLVDRVFRKTGSSFKIPLSKKMNLIAPARIEFPGGSQAMDRTEHARHNKSMDFGKLIKRSRLSQINGKETGFVGGLWHRKYGSDRKHSLHKEIKLKKRKKEHAKEYSAKSGLNLLAEYAAKSSTDLQKKKRKVEETNGSTNLSPESPNKKRKPGRPKKCDVVRPGVTETIVAKQSKHMDFFRWQADDTKQERKISLEGKTPLKPLYLDEWNVRRSERIFLSDPSPQTSPNAISPGVKAKPEVTKQEKDRKPKQEKQKKSQSLSMSQKVKKKYSTGFSQHRAREKTTELLKATRDRLTQKRQEKKMMLKTSVCNDDDSDSDDIPLSLFKPKPKVKVELPLCTLTADDLCDGIRILVFMDGLFHEGELKAIRPPDIYGAILDNERKTRPHYYSQEEILKEAIKDTKPLSGDQLKEGTRICAYWSQQFSCLYPGTISRGTPNPITDRSLYNVEFDDGDTGKIPLDHIRIIPQDFPHVEYDPNPLLLLTARRRTMSTSESVSTEPKKSVSESSKDPKIKRGPGRPPKAERLMSNESMGDEDVFISDTQKDHDKKNKSGNKNGSDEKKGQVTLFRPRGLWEWSGSCTKRPGMKGKAKKEYYKTVVRARESLSVGECAVFLSTGRPNLPYVGRIESFWEGWGGQMVVKVKWFYHPEETKGGKRLQNMKGALFRSDHEDENDVQTISHKCEVISYAEYRRRIDVISHEDTDDVYYLAGSYEPTIGHIKFEPGVV